MHAHLQGLVDDLVEQHGESTQILGYQHVRLLSKLAAVEKVNRLRANIRQIIHTFFRLACFSKSHSRMELEYWQCDFDEISSTIERIKHD